MQQFHTHVFIYFSLKQLEYEKNTIKYYDGLIQPPKTIFLKISLNNKFGWLKIIINCETMNIINKIKNIFLKKIEWLIEISFLSTKNIYPNLKNEKYV